MTTGNHKITLTATLPSGKTFTAPAYTVYVYNAGLEASVNGGTFSLSPINFTRADNVHFRVAQLDAKGKTLTITKAEWKFHNTATAAEVLGTDDGLAANATDWQGVMHQSGTVSAKLTIQVGRLSRTSHSDVAATAVGAARTGTTWTTVQHLCENCFDDLGITGGGTLNAGLVLPTDQNIQDIPKIPAADNALALGMSGDRDGYANGIIPDAFVTQLAPHTVFKAYPLYRPLNVDNDPAEWPNRYTLTQISSGPNKGYWYATDQRFHTEWAYAVSAYLNPNSGPGANPANYYNFVFDANCGNVADPLCYTAMTLACWPSTYTGQSYMQAATAAGYQMGLLLQQIQDHDKRRHWQEFLVDYVAANPGTYDIGTIMENTALLGGTELAARASIDSTLRAIDADYVIDPLGGKNEFKGDPKAPFPLISATCVLH